MTNESEGGAERPEKSSRRALSYVVPGVGIFALLTGGLVFTAYQYLDGMLYIDGRTVSDFSIFEVTGGAALGVIGMVAGLIATAASAVAAIATVIVGLGISAGALGLAALVAVGVVTGPILLVAIIVWAIRRRYWPDVI